jgi:hypothetical protein
MGGEEPPGRQRRQGIGAAGREAPPAPLPLASLASWLFLLPALLLLTGGCQRGCARSALESNPAARLGSGFGDLQGVDCPGRLARCESGSVSVSHQATLPGRCEGTPSACACPWEAIGECHAGCVSEGLEMVVDAPLAAAQLCALTPDAGAVAGPWIGDVLPATSCDEGDSHRCTGGVVVDCRSASPVGRCLRGCYREGAAVPDDEPSRERAFALLCSR